jgi:predicted metal-dependent hydrolase
MGEYWDFRLFGPVELRSTDGRRRPSLHSDSASGGQECPPHRSGPQVEFWLMTLESSEGYRRGIRLFNAREFYDAHEVWEDVWRESHGMEKKFLQGLIQAAVALHHRSTGNVVGACSLAERARRNLGGCPAEFGGIAVGELIAALGEWRAAVVRGEGGLRCPVIGGSF